MAERNYEKYGQDKKTTLIDIKLNEKIKKRVEEEEQTSLNSYIGVESLVYYRAGNIKPGV